MVNATEAGLDAIDRLLEGIDYEVEIKIEVNERKLSRLERLFEELEDDAYDGAERIANLVSGIETEYENMATNIEGLKKTLQTAGVSEADI
jgi:hypothetical protein